MKGDLTINTIDFGVGKVVYNEFHIDFDIPLFQQKSELVEDLLQVSYPNSFLLDVGWYPEYSLDGSFIVQVIKDGEWLTPYFTRRCYTREDLKSAIKAGIKTVGDKRQGDGFRDPIR